MLKDVKVTTKWEINVHRWCFCMISHFSKIFYICDTPFKTTLLKEDLEQNLIQISGVDTPPLFIPPPNIKVVISKTLCVDLIKELTSLDMPQIETFHTYYFVFLGGLRKKPHNSPPPLYGNWQHPSIWISWVHPPLG